MKHYQLLLIEGKGNEEEGEGSQEANEEGLELAHKTLQLSLRSKEGLTSKHSFKTWGRIGGKANLVKELKLQVEVTLEFVVEVGNGSLVRNKGVFKDLPLEVQGIGIGIKQNLFLLDLGGTEVVLGMDWLTRLSRRDPSLIKAQAAWKTLLKAIQHDGSGFVVSCQLIINEESVIEEYGSGFVVSCQLIINEESVIEELPAEFGVLLTEFDDLFQEPKGLPPKREQDHKSQIYVFSDTLTTKKMR
ncbi:hypothetical protein CR513_53825, partial [Mucuna pruriens]